jgi:hypothetical protein
VPAVTNNETIEIADMTRLTQGKQQPGFRPSSGSYWSANFGIPRLEERLAVDEENYPTIDTEGVNVKHQ